MHFTEGQLNFFIDNVLKIDPKKAAEYRRQVVYLEDAIETKINEDSSFHVIKHLRAGSFRKGTVLRPKGDIPVDVDIALFLQDGEASDYDVRRLHQLVKNFLIAIYPNKKPEDFPVQPRTNHIIFQVSGLEVDVVPVLPEDDTCDYGLQPSSQGGNPTRTSVKRQLEFIRAHKEADPRFTSLVRMAKYWRNEKELEISSYALELILCHIQDVQGTVISLEDGILRFFLYIYRTELKEPVTFDSKNIPDFIDPVVVLDPPNPENNVTRWIKETDRVETIGRAKEAWETLTYARRVSTKGETVELWKEIFGRSFKVEE